MIGKRMNTPWFVQSLSHMVRFFCQSICYENYDYFIKNWGQIAVVYIFRVTKKDLSDLVSHLTLIVFFLRPTYI